MKLINPKHPVRASWLREMAFRMDASPFISGALEARKTLEALNVNKDMLYTLTAGHDGGIYNGPHFSRTYVDSPEHGVPFVGSADMLNADLSTLPLLSKKDAHTARLRYLELRHGMTLISCSGTIGNTVYCRQDMEGMWSSQHVMKVCADDSKVSPGYLYAFICSKYGIPIVVSGTYGSIIQSIQPEHLASLPVPRFGQSLEHEVHSLVESASQKRSTASNCVQMAVESFYDAVCNERPQDWWEYGTPLVSMISSNELGQRLDAYYFGIPNRDARTAFDNSGCTRRIGEIADVFIPGIFKRRYAEDPSFGVPYLTGADVFNITPSTDRHLLRAVVDQYGLSLSRGMIVIQEAGQLSGIIGRAVMVGEYLDGFACSNNMVRVIPNSSQDSGYVYAALSSEYGVRLVKREAAGSSIPHLDKGRVEDIQIPWPDPVIRSRIGRHIEDATQLRDEANDEERQAIHLVEEAIEENA
ncbi:Type I restriction modification DNA specificity domain protein [Gimesia chilikensis]|uniref:Type I restriction modification DNA specificity domain protein n=1 Tax=Gimesia chilikensis TaxID=2605989 RepID=A0A517WAY4_9PLAN|nr:hypothetical protein [Gimesia chilikensis]QDU02411.1 Type I restriction modification DNA specificity domain protein [Gimesia chilikensis]